MFRTFLSLFSFYRAKRGSIWFRTLSGFPFPIRWVEASVYRSMAMVMGVEFHDAEPPEDPLVPVNKHLEPYGLVATPHNFLTEMHQLVYTSPFAQVQGRVVRADIKVIITRIEDVRPGDFRGVIMQGFFTELPLANAIDLAAAAIIYDRIHRRAVDNFIGAHGAEELVQNMLRNRQLDSLV